MMTLWVPTALIRRTAVEFATTASVSAGAPVDNSVHDPLLIVRPSRISCDREHVGKRIGAGTQRVDAQGAVLGQESVRRLRRLMHTSSVAGSSDTEETAVAVKPAIPARPTVVTTCTAAPSWLIASRNCAGSYGCDVLRGVGLEGAHHGVVGTFVEPAHVGATLLHRPRGGGTAQSRDEIHISRNTKSIGI